ncbi:hypothetical protein D3C84_1245490 [compost metagenome]
MESRVDHTAAMKERRDAERFASFELVQEAIDSLLNPHGDVGHGNHDATIVNGHPQLRPNLE